MTKTIIRSYKEIYIFMLVKLKLIFTGLTKNNRAAKNEPKKKQSKRKIYVSPIIFTLRKHKIDRCENFKSQYFYISMKEEGYSIYLNIKALCYKFDS